MPTADKPTLPLASHAIPPPSTSTQQTLADSTHYVRFSVRMSVCLSVYPSTYPQEDIPDIQLAWENLEMARQIYAASPSHGAELGQVRHRATQ